MLTAPRALLTMMACGIALAVTAGPASAFQSTDGTPAFTGSTPATQTYTVRGGGGVFRATSATFNGTTSTLSGPIASTTPVYSGATSLIAGFACPASIVESAPWTLTSTTSTPPYAFAVNRTGTVTITACGFTGALVIPSQVKTGGVAANSGLNVSLAVNNTGLSWTATGQLATILGATSGTDGTYSSGGSTITLLGVNAP